MLYLPSWKTDYLQLLSQIDRIFGDRMLHDGWEKLVDVSVGTFRISQEYMKKSPAGRTFCTSGTVSLCQLQRGISVSTGIIKGNGKFYDHGINTENGQGEHIS